MAKLIGEFNFIGQLGNLSAYTMKGSDKIIIRRKGGASKKKIRNDASFVRTRENNTEFSGCVRTTAAIRHVIFPVKHLADYNFTATLNALTKSIQRKDEISRRGERNVYLSQHKHLLQGFQLNQNHPFDSVVRHPASVIIDRQACKAIITLPDMEAGYSLQVPWKQPLFHFTFVLGTVKNAIFNGTTFPKPDLRQIAVEDTAWQSIQQSSPAQTITLQLPMLPPDDGVTFIVAGGFEMGVPVSMEGIGRVKHAGCAKILAVG